MIIDCHTHIFPDEVRSNREAFCGRDEGFSSIYRNPKAKLAGASDLLAVMEDCGVGKAVICGFPWRDPDLCRLHNEYLLESASRHPGRLIVFASLPLPDPDASWKEFERVRKGGATGIGEIAFYGNEMTSGDIDRMSPVLKTLEDGKFPLLLHTNEILGHPYPGKGRTPLERFYELILLFPNLPVILAHWGGGLPFYELMPEIEKAMRNVWYDTAASPFLFSNKIYAAARVILGIDKILFGSDFPLISPGRYFRELDAAGLSPEERDKVLGLNFLRLLESRSPLFSVPSVPLR